MWYEHSISKLKLGVLIFLSDSWDNFLIQWWSLSVCLPHNFHNAFLDFECKTQLGWDPENWSIKIKENIMVCGLVHEDTELTTATYDIFLFIFHLSLLFEGKD